MLSMEAAEVHVNVRISVCPAVKDPCARMYMPQYSRYTYVRIILYTVPSIHTYVRKYLTYIRTYLGIATYRQVTANPGHTSTTPV